MNYVYFRIKSFVCNRDGKKRHFLFCRVVVACARDDDDDENEVNLLIAKGEKSKCKLRRRGY